MSDVKGEAIPGLEREILRESIRSRCAQAIPAAFALFAGFAVLALAMVGQVPPLNLILWFMPLGGSVAWRAALAKRALERLDSAGPEELERLDRSLRRNSMVNQAICGAGVWIVSMQGSDWVAFFVTLAIMMFGVGAMINLTSDIRSFQLSMPLLMGQPILFWLLSGIDGLRIALPLALLSAIMLSLVRGSAKSFAESVRMRFEKNLLLERVEQQRATTEEALQLANSAMRTRALFLAAASHDLRQPLYAISILADTLSAETLPEASVATLEKQRQAIGILRHLFDNLLDISRLDAGEVRPQPRLLPLREILGPLATEHEVLSHAKGLRWVCEIAPVWVHTDPELLRRIVANLLSNAIRYTPAGTVSLTASADGARAMIVVADTGIGIAPAEQERIFEEFVQLANPARVRDKGVGLGLSIVKKLGSLLDVKLKLDSAPEAGTRVSLEIPLAEAGRDMAVEAPAEPTATAAFAAMRLWIVEDDPTVCDAYGAQFTQWDVDFAFAHDRADLAKLREADGEWPDAVMLDDMLGVGEGGLEVAHWLARQMGQERILIVTGNVDAQRARALEESPFVVLRKPVSSGVLADWLRRAMAAAKAARSSRAGAREGSPERGSGHPVPETPH